MLVTCAALIVVWAVDALVTTDDNALADISTTCSPDKPESGTKTADEARNLVLTPTPAALEAAEAPRAQMEEAKPFNGGRDLIEA